MNRPASRVARPRSAAMAGFFPVQTIYTLIRLAFGKSQPPDCVPPREAIPDILHGSYHRSVQSPASSHTRFGHNLPTRLIRITKFPLVVKREFCIYYRFFCVIFVQNADCGLAADLAQNMVFCLPCKGRWRAKRAGGVWLHETPQPPFGGSSPFRGAGGPRH